MGKTSTAEVLRLRATNAVSRDKSVRRFAQDDDFVEVLKKNILNRLALMGRSPFQRLYYEGHPSRPKTWWEIKTANARRADVFLQLAPHVLQLRAGKRHYVVAAVDVKHFAAHPRRQIGSQKEGRVAYFGGFYVPLERRAFGMHLEHF
jgi:hypothetical protein